jgi:hypothetical protein
MPSPTNQPEASVSKTKRDIRNKKDLENKNQMMNTTKLEQYNKECTKRRLADMCRE